MVYEAEIPKIPDRKEELEMIQKLEDNFISQPYYKWYMNEHFRLNKMELYQDKNEINNNFRRNFGIGMILLGLIAMPFTSMYNTKSSGVPQYFTPKVYYASQNFQNIHAVRNWKSLRIIIPGMLIGSYLLATRYTDSSKFMDENYENSKVKLPY